MEENNLLGLVHVYDKKADETTVSWSYKDSSDLKHFVLSSFPYFFDIFFYTLFLTLT